jgi:hypothetical protein
MRINVWLFASIGLANASALLPRDAQNDDEDIDTSVFGFTPKSSNPQFFNLRVDDQCADDETADQCPFEGYAIRLQDGNVIALPYNKWFQSNLPVFFVDDDTKAYTVSHFTPIKL